MSLRKPIKKPKKVKPLFNAKEDLRKNPTRSGLYGSSVNPRPKTKMRMIKDDA